MPLLAKQVKINKYGKMTPTKELCTYGILTLMKIYAFCQGNAVLFDALVPLCNFVVTFLGNPACDTGSPD